MTRKIITLSFLIAAMNSFAYGNEKFESHYDNGQLKETGFKNEKGQRVGTWTRYYENGQKHVSIPYEEGTLHGELIIYYKNGQLRGKESRKHGTRHGEWTAYGLDGQMKWKKIYKDGVEQGEGIEYGEEGGVSQAVVTKLEKEPSFAQSSAQNSSNKGDQPVVHPKLKLSDSKESLVLGNGGTIQKILVLGAVHNPGYRPIKQGIAMRLQAAIEISGGLTSEAEESGIRILRPKSNESGKGEGYITLRPVSLSDGESNTFKLQPGDIVFVPKREAITVSGGAKVLDIAENLSTEEVISSLETQNKRVLQEIEMQKEKISALKDRKNVAKLYEAETKQLKRLEDLHDLLNKRLDTIRNTIKSDSPSKNK